MRKICLLLFFTIQFLNAQSNYYYYYHGQKVFLELDRNYINVFTSNNFDVLETSDLNFKSYVLENDKILTSNKYAKIENNTLPTSIEFIQKINSLKIKPNIKGIGLYFKTNGTTSVGTSNYFYVKLKSTSDFSTLQQYCSQKSVQIIKQVPNMELWYILSVTNTQLTSLELSNQFYESGLFSDTDPAFMFNFKSSCANDPRFGSLWGLNNTENPNIDINACQAWNLSQGAGINVAVLDEGIFTTHNDLAGNIAPLSFNAQTGTSPSIFNRGQSHGTFVAGIIGALKDNNLHTVGVAPQAKIMPISHTFNSATLSAELASGISWAYQSGADIINNSWSDPDPNGSGLGSPILEDAIIAAMTLGRNNKGTIVVFATGNENRGLRYPLSIIPNIIAVGSITSNGDRSDFSNYGSLLDVVAPGSDILSTMPNNSVGYKSGTSFAGPHVAGVVALILSSNPCLTLQQVTDIIEQTAQKVGNYTYAVTAGRPNGTWNNEMGYGLVDAHAAVLMAQNMASATLDLYVKDGQDDTGAEPNTTTPFMWTSDNIWVRNNNDNGLMHQNPEYSANGNPNYVKVRVINKSCVASTGNEQLKLYWAKAATDLVWPTYWTGDLVVNNIPFGGEAGTLNIPVLQPGQETILTFNWQVPNPNDYITINPDPWHFCLLTRIVSNTDPMSFSETWDVNANTQNNNNIA